MTRLQIKKIDNLRRGFYARDEFLGRVYKQLEMFSFLKQDERERAILYLRKEILKEIRDVELKKDLISTESVKEKTNGN